MVWTWRSYRKYATRQDYRGTKERGLIEFFSDIPGLRDDPKIVGRDDTKVVGDSVAKAVPFFGNSSPKEAQDCRSELGEGFIASIIGDMFVHYAPASFDRIKMRTIGRDEVQPDPASQLPQPLTHQNRVVVSSNIRTKSCAKSSSTPSSERNRLITNRRSGRSWSG